MSAAEETWATRVTLLVADIERFTQVRRRRHLQTISPASQRCVDDKIEMLEKDLSLLGWGPISPRAMARSRLLSHPHTPDSLLRRRANGQVDRPDSGLLTSALMNIRLMRGVGIL